MPGQCQITFFLKSSCFISCFRKVLQREAYILLVNFYYSIFCFYQIDFMTFSNQIKKFSSHRTTNRISWFSFPMQIITIELFQISLSWQSNKIHTHITSSHSYIKMCTHTHTHIKTGYTLKTKSHASICVYQIHRESLLLIIYLSLSLHMSCYPKLSDLKPKMSSRKDKKKRENNIL